MFGSDFSTDNGQTFANNKLLYSASISLPFTRGYVHFNPRNHATVKYGFGPDVVFHWDNIGFDGPVIAAPRAYEIPDNTVVTSYNGNQVQNLGYQLYDGTTGKAAGIYNLSTKMNSLIVSEREHVRHYFGDADDERLLQRGYAHGEHELGISYRFNGGTWENSESDSGRSRVDKCHRWSAARPPFIGARCSDGRSGFRKQHSGTASAKCSDGLSARCRQYRLAFGGVRVVQSLAGACTHSGIFGEPD